MQVIRYPEKSEWKDIVRRPTFETASLESIVTSILDDVKLNGDSALRRYTARFDKAEIEDFAVSESEFDEAENSISAELKQAILHAKENLEKFHRSQIEKPEKIETTPGVVCWRESRAIERVGLYIPGGTAPLFSTVLMLAIPARIAGCEEIVLCSPPDTAGKIHPAILFSARVCGATKIFKVGGVQAIAAMAYGTETVRQVYKIFGPGNQFVTAAKQMVAREGTALDMPAGPSEVAVLADETAVPAFVAADLLSQAEHGADSQVLFVTTEEKMIEPVLRELENQLNALPRRDLTAQALENSRTILVKNPNEAIELLNEYAPEHLILACRDDEQIAAKIVNAGSVFLGNYSCESAGDYASGTNHTLPTNAAARTYSGVSVDSFVKKITFQKLSAEGIKNLGATIETMAAAEGLEAHKNAVTLRLKEVAQKKAAV
ncbi:MAG: histidinol dehydrogenase [Acidobacteriota bacterium]|nr:histidinol dehydrogenase [Acidobacteriota bacterium]